jgi:hypothetical protein
LLVDDIKNDILINELQLGEKLNECIHHKERSQFSLLLAMLTDDVQAHSQFSLPRTEELSSASDEDNLRKLFKLPPEQALSLDGVENIEAFNQADLIQDNTLSGLYLTNALKPVPLAFRNDIKFISKDVLNNTSLYCQKKYEDEITGQKKESSRLNFKAEEWLNTVNESMKSHVELTA